MRWPPFQHVFLDCDSTLTSVEGIDALAKQAGKGWRIKVLTDAAMNGEVDLEDVYDKRLRAIRPTRGQITALRQIYKKHMVPDAGEVIAALQYLGHSVYIISGGLLEPVREFGIHLGVPTENIRAVGVKYDQLRGEWWLRSDDEDGDGTAARYVAYDQGNLTASDGKARIVRELLSDQPGRALLIGDGISDLLASRAVDLFVGFGGVVNRQQVRQKSPIFISNPSLSPLLPLAGGPAAIKLLQNTPHLPVMRRAFQLIDQGAISFQDEQLKVRFSRAYQAVYPGSG